MDSLTRTKQALGPRPPNRLLAQRLKVHLNAGLVTAIESHMLPVIKNKIRPKKTIQMAQQITIESSRHAKRIVICGFKHRPRLDPVNADQNAPPWTAGRAHRPNLLQQAEGLVRGKVSDARSWIKDHPWPIVETELRKPRS